MDIGKVIKEARKSKGLKQQSFAEMCGITQTYLSQIENNDILSLFTRDKSSSFAILRVCAKWLRLCIICLLSCLKRIDLREILLKALKVHRHLVFFSTLKLKEIQKRINKSILNKMSIPKYIFGGAKGKDNVLNAKQHQGKKFKFITDLTNFFPSITNKMVYDVYIAYHFSPDVASLAN